MVDGLKAKGAVFVEELSEVPEGALTIFSAHGVARSVVEEAADRGLPVIDATCPLVSKVHSQGKHYVARGRTLVLIGHAGHPEVEGTLGQVPGPVHRVATLAEVEALDLPEDARIAYVTQTTLSVDDTRTIIDALKARFSDVVGPGESDICYATQHRQSSVRELCKIADVIIVVGASNSSNSNRLREIGREEGLPSYLIASAEELDPAWLDGVDVVGLTAGASAPEALVEGVIAALRAIDSEAEVGEMDGIDENIQFRLPAVLRHGTGPGAADVEVGARS